MDIRSKRCAKYELISLATTILFVVSGYFSTNVFADDGRVFSPPTSLDLPPGFTNVSIYDSTLAWLNPVTSYLPNGRDYFMGAALWPCAIRPTNACIDSFSIESPSGGKTNLQPVAEAGIRDVSPMSGLSLYPSETFPEDLKINRPEGAPIILEITEFVTK